jgi:hypothetical protein
MIPVHLRLCLIWQCRERHVQNMLKRLFHDSNLLVSLPSVGLT